ncbi:hypothetical protein BU17DRAFT_76629 [Hysterangium stoloniferum]|nr:hypothetical protein BU17DRAFT_76629 [Hysterangium stoloniferum]
MVVEIKANAPIVISTLLHPSMVPLLPPTPPAVPFPEDPSFEIKQTPYKGAGMFSTRDIAAGELILAEHPVIILPNKPIPYDDAYDELELQLPVSQREEMLTLTNCRPYEECHTSVEGIARTNALALQFKFPEEMKDQGREYGGIFLKINRCNHSCGPNAAPKWSLDTLSSSLYALRPIRAGEEITITYIDPTHPQSDRVAKLQQNYRFTCDCPHCSLVLDDQVQKSNEARMQLRDWFHTHPTFTKWHTDLCRSDDTVISSHLAALDLIDQEGMHGLQGLFLEEIALCYAVLGDEEQFKYWGQRFVERCRVEDDGMTREIRGWLEREDKRQWKKWAWRKKQQELFLFNRDKSKAKTSGLKVTKPYL